MKANDLSTRAARPEGGSRRLPSFAQKIGAVWIRHYTVYRRHFFTNSFFIVVEPIIFITAVGWGLASAIGGMGGMDYLSFI
ncbi:MAG: hypothetical protein ACREL1_05205, partial [bacterium]